MPVLSSRNAAKATLDLNAGLCERRERRPDDFLFITNSFRLAIVGQAICPESAFISVVQIYGATSLCFDASKLKRSSPGVKVRRIVGSVTEGKGFLAPAALLIGNRIGFVVAGGGRMAG
jgi:hypothetical protein